jgi:hypothetical protein
MLRDSGGSGDLNGGVYSDGPRNIYTKLNNGLKPFNTPKKNDKSLNYILYVGILNIV